MMLNHKLHERYNLLASFRADHVFLQNFGLRISGYAITVNRLVDKMRLVVRAAVYAAASAPAICTGVAVIAWPNAVLAYVRSIPAPLSAGSGT